MRVPGRRLLISFMAVMTVVSGIALNAPAAATALAGSDFQPGRIIDDAIFYDANSMSASTIQVFLNSKVPTCDTNHAAASGNNPPFTCLKDYSQATPDEPAQTGLCKTYTGGTKTAAQIIYDVAQACGINPKVLIVLLEKEESLVTDSWPWAAQYQTATGYACPDSGSCDNSYYGFFNQLYNAAQQFQRYAYQASQFSYRSGRSNYIQYNPDASCGGTNVFIQNQATADLYNYTPYQPNAAALNNLSGTGDSCSAYGNRNFWKLFNDWFGATTTNSYTNTINFVRLNHYSGNMELLGYPSIGNYSYANKDYLLPYADDPTAVPIFRPNGDLSIVKLNDPSGKVVVTTYSAASNFQQLSSRITTAYPAVTADGSVIPLFRPNGDLSFIRLNHYSGHVEVVTYSFNSYFQIISSHVLTPYPAVTADGSVIPLFRPNGDLSFIRLNHYSGHVEVVTYSADSGLQQFSSQIYSAYPAVTADGSVVPMFMPNGDLGFVRLNYYTGQVQLVTYSFTSYFQLIQNQTQLPYPTITDYANVKTLVSN